MASKLDGITFTTKPNKLHLHQFYFCLLLLTNSTRRHFTLVERLPFLMNFQKITNVQMLPYLLMALRVHTKRNEAIWSRWLKTYKLWYCYIQRISNLSWIRKWLRFYSTGNCKLKCILEQFASIHLKKKVVQSCHAHPFWDGMISCLNEFHWLLWTKLKKNYITDDWYSSEAIC